MPEVGFGDIFGPRGVHEAWDPSIPVGLVNLWPEIHCMISITSGRL